MSILVAAATVAFVFSGCAFHDRAQTAGHTSPDKAIQMTGAGIAGNLITPGFHADAVIVPAASVGTVDMGNIGILKNIFNSPIMKSQSMSPGKRGGPFSAIWFIIQRLNPLRLFRPMVCPGGMH